MSAWLSHDDVLRALRAEPPRRKRYVVPGAIYVRAIRVLRSLGLCHVRRRQ